jgi:hypothetical protein
MSQLEFFESIDSDVELTQDDISFASLLLQNIGVIVATEHNANIRVSLLDNIRLLLRADKNRVFVIGVFLVQSVESIAGNVAGHASAVSNTSVEISRCWIHEGRT